MTAAIELQQLTKRFKERSAVDHLDLTVEQGEIFGFVGPNGAGKTTTLRMIACLLAPTSGEIKVMGHSASHDPDAVRSAIGYMPDFFGVYNDLSVEEYLDFFGACYKLPPAERARLANDLLELVELSHRRTDPVERLSRGMQQRLSLARTLVHDPQVLLLDEPASGLDPRARVEIRELMRELARMGKTIFFSTHILADVAEICTRVGILEAGQLVALGELEALQQQLLPRRQVDLTVLATPENTLALLNAYMGVVQAQPVEENGAANGGVGSGRTRLRLEFSGDDAALAGLLAHLVHNGVAVMHFSEDRRDLEEVFLRATRGQVT